MKKIYSLIAVSFIALQSFSQLNLLWNTQYNNVYGYPGTTDDANKVVADGIGNFYLTGFSHNNVTTLKYDINGNMVWEKIYNGAYNGSDEGKSLALDGLGNLYVVGYEGVGAGVSSDMLTLKYDTAGNLLWTRTFSGTNLSGGDEAYAVKCDASGNVYVTGSTYGSGSFEDMTTLKYSPTGTLMWSNILNGPGLNIDRGMDIDLDNQGNVYVAGYLSYNSTYTSCGLVKYNNAGTQQWSVTSGSNGYDYWADVFVSPTNQVFVCGAEFGGTSINGEIARYNPVNGASIWIHNYNDPANGTDEFRKMTRDPANGDLYFVGNAKNSVSANGEMIMAKYDSSGVFQWEHQNTGSSATSDYTFDVTMDGTGNIWSSGYVVNATGAQDLSVVEYNSAGTQLYFDSYNDPYNSNENALSMVYYNNAVYVAGFRTEALPYQDYLFIKYNTAGSRSWIRTYSPVNSPADVSTAVTTDAAGNIYVAGTTRMTAGRYADIMVLKFNSTGVFQWQYTYAGTAGFVSDNANGIAVDNSGNVYVCGYVNNTGTMKDAVAIKINSTGGQQWVSTYNLPAQNKDDVFSAIDVDASGNVYVTGYSTVNASNATDILTVKYNSAGVQQWAPTYSGTATNSIDLGSDLEVDASGNVYVTGKAMFTASLDDIMTIKYSSAGAQTWAWAYNNSTNYNDLGKYCKLAPDGDLYVTGYKHYSNGTKDIITLRYNTTTGATPNYALLVDNNGDEEPYALTVDASNNVYIAGNYSTISGFDMLSLKYSFNMTQRFLKTKSGNSSPLSTDAASSIFVNTAAGKVYTTGAIENGPLNYKDMAVVVYDTLGNELNYLEINNTQGTSDYPTAIFSDASNNIGVVGWYGWNSDADILISKYCNPATVGSLATATASVCPGTQGVVYSVVPVAGATSYSWNYGGSGVTINGSGPSVTLDFSMAATSDTLYVSAVNACGVGNPLKYHITVKPAADVNIGLLFPWDNDTVCHHTLVSFHPYGTSYSTLLWSPGGYTNTGNRGYYIDSNMTITIIGTTSGGCMDTASMNVVCLPRPTASFVSTNTTITPGSSVNYTSTSTGSPVQWNWYFQGGTPATSTATNPSGILYPGAGSFSSTLVVTNSVGCKDSINQPYYVNVSGPLPPLVEIYSYDTTSYKMSNGVEAEKKYQLLLYNDANNGYVTKIDGSGNVMWTKKFIGLGVHDAAVADSNHYYIASVIPKNPVGTCTILTLLDKNGNMQWQKKYDDATTAEYGETSISTSRDKCALLLVSYNNGSATGFVAMKIDTLGNILWNNYAYPPGGEADGSQIMETIAGDVLTLSSCYTSSSFNFLLVRYSSTGVYQWQKTIGNTLHGAFDVHMQENPDSTIILLGDDAVLGPGTDIVIAKADKNGNGLWVKSLGWGQMGWFFDAGLALQSNGNISLGISFVSDNISGIGWHEDSFGLFGFDPAMDTMKWNTWIQGSTHMGDVFYSNLYSPKLKPMKDGDFAVYTTYQDYVTHRWSPMMMRAYTNGNFNGCYQDTLVPHLSNLTLANPSDNIQYGSSPITPVTYAGVFGTIPVTHVSCSAVVITSENQNSQDDVLSMKLFPNPASFEVNIVLPEAGGSLNIYDGMGNLVKTFKADSKEMKIDFSEFSAGIYLFEWRTGDIRQVSRIVKD
jgi:uncharacterized delta-60 repeat protein